MGAEKAAGAMSAKGAAGPLAVRPPEPAKLPPLAGPNVMNIVMVGAECAPWSKTGAAH
jgi:hypothetical protein